MNRLFLKTETFKRFARAAAACLLIALAAAANIAAQYKGAPVKKDRLLSALRSKQLQTSDIVTIIKRNGVDFRLTAELRKSLAAAGARPEVIEAVANNVRPASRTDALTAKAGTRSKARRPAKPAAPSYDELLTNAMRSYREQRNASGAVRILQTAARTNPQNPAAYQMLGFVYMYGMNDFAQAEQSMRESLSNGGSAVFRVFHDDNGKFSRRCTGSLYISKDSFRFESDDNHHTFETATANVDKIKFDTKTTKTWKKHSVFKVFLKIGGSEADFRFAPLTGEKQESLMVERFIARSNRRTAPSGMASAR